MKPLKVKCPHCKKEFEYYSSEYRPFCTERCKMVDLGHWLEESYTVPAQNLTQEEQDDLVRLVEEHNEEQ